MDHQLKFLGYVRKSSEGDDRQAQSIETQTRILLEYAGKYHLNLIDIVHEARSAKVDGNRPMFDSVINRLKRGEANGLFVAHIDRLARNATEAAVLDKLLSSGVIQEIKTPLRTYTANDDLSLGIEFLFAANYSKRLSQRVKEGIETKLRRGEYPSVAPLGYVNHNKNIVPDPIRAPIVTELFDKYSTGQYSLFEITKMANGMGLKSKPNNKRIVKAVVHRLLTNPTYYGVILNKGVLYEGKHQPLITKDVFDKVQDVLSGKRVCGKTPRVFLYRDFLTCGECGCKLTADIKKGKHIYYYCTNGKDHCSQHKHYLQESITQTLIQKILDDFALPEKLATASLSQYIQDAKVGINQQLSIADYLIKEINHHKLKLSKIEDAYFDGDLSKDRYLERKIEVQNEITNLTTQLKQATPPKNSESTFELMEEFKRQAIHIAEMFESGNDEIRRELMLSALSNCEIKDKIIVSTRYKKPYSYFVGLSKTDDLLKWRRRWDSNPRIPFGI